MSSEIKIKEVSPLAMYTHCFSHCLNLSIAASCKVQEVRNLIGVINEAYLFLTNSPKRQRFFETTVSCLSHHIQEYMIFAKLVGWSGICALKSSLKCMKLMSLF